MKEKEIFFKAGEIDIEGRIAENRGKSGVVICHPHPRLGGSMENNVVDTLSKVFFNCDFTTLRFNFRGVGKSSGSFSGGEGAQEDLWAAVSYLEGMDKDDIYLAGYSFGAWVGAKEFMADKRVAESIFIAPPVDLYDFSFYQGKGDSTLIIYGNEDDFCSLPKLEEQFNDLEKDRCFREIRHADHFFGGKEEKIKDIIEVYLQKGGVKTGKSV